MSLLEIDRLKVPLSTGDGETELDYSQDPGSICCIHSHDNRMLSALFDILAGFTSGFEGRIFLAGRAIGGLSLAERGIAACGSDVGIYDHLTVAGNLAVPAGNRLERDASLHGILEKTLWEFRLDNLAGLYPEELSISDRFMLSVAKAVIADPVLVVCNLIQPSTSGFQGFDLANDLKKHAKRMELTMLIITDDAFTALNVAEDIAVVGEKGVIQRGSPKDMVTSPESLEVAKALAIPGLNIFSGTVTEEQPFMFVEGSAGFFNLPSRMKDYFRTRVGENLMMAARPEVVQLVHPEDTKTTDKNRVTIKRTDYVGIGVFAYFDFGDSEWCAFLPPEKVVYTGMNLAVYVAEDAWFFSDKEGNILLDL